MVVVTTLRCFAFLVFSGSFIPPLDNVTTVNVDPPVLFGCPASGVPLQEEPVPEEEPAEGAAVPWCLGVSSVDCRISLGYFVGGGIFLELSAVDAICGRFSCGWY